MWLLLSFQGSKSIDESGFPDDDDNNGRLPQPKINIEHSKSHPAKLNGVTAAEDNHKKEAGETEDDISDLISAFGLSPENDRRKRLRQKQQQQQVQQQSGVSYSWKKSEPVRLHEPPSASSNSYLANGNAGIGATRLEKMPRFLEGSSAVEVQQQQLQLHQQSLPRRFSVNRRQQQHVMNNNNNKINDNWPNGHLPRLNPTKLSPERPPPANLDLSRKQFSQPQTISNGDIKPTTLTFSTNKQQQHQHHHHPRRRQSPTSTTSLFEVESRKNVGFLTAARNKFFPSSRSLPDFGGKSNSSTGFVNKYTPSVITAAAPAVGEEKKPIQVRTDWAAKYLK